MSFFAQSNTGFKANSGTPCIGVCSTGIGDSVCRGCKRFLHEIVNWNAYSEVEQQYVWQRLEILLEQIIADKLQLINEEKLSCFLLEQGIEYATYRRPLCWIYVLLRAGAGQIEAWQQYGIGVQPKHAHKSASELRDEIDKEYYQLSCAHYHRYFEAVHVVD